MRAANYILDENASGADAKLALDALNEMSGVLGILYRDMTVLPDEVAGLAAQRAEAPRAEKLGVIG